MRTSKAVLGVLAGMATGAAVGVFLGRRKRDLSKAGILEKGEALAEAINRRIDEKFDDLVQSMYTQTRGYTFGEDQFDGE